MAMNNDDIRSNRYIYLASCILSQGIRAEGIVKHFSAAVDPVVELLMRNKINIRSMPCPELYFDDVLRPPCHKAKYDTEANRKVYKAVSGLVANEIRKIVSAGYEVIGVVGIEFSPSCAVNKLGGSRFAGGIEQGPGIFIEELQNNLKSKTNLTLPFMGMRIYQMESSMKELERFISPKLFT
jgi:predicted secreted protein